MECEEIQDRMPDFLSGDLKESLRTAIAQHLETCGPCRADAEFWAKMAALPEEQPSPQLRQRFYTMLEQEQRVNETRAWWHPANWIPQRPALQFGLAALLLIGGWMVGRLPQSTGTATSGEIASLRSEVRSLRETMALALLQQSSAADRLKGVSYCASIERPHPGVVSALLRTLSLDGNVDVRLAAVDALRRFREDSSVRQGLAAAVDKQASPLVQIEVIQALVELRAQEASPVLAKLKADADVHEMVRERASWALTQLESGKYY